MYVPVIPIPLDYSKRKNRMQDIFLDALANFLDVFAVKCLITAFIQRLPDFLHQGVKDKLSCAKEMLEAIGMDFSEMSYIGDDVNDIPLLRAAALRACPADAADEVKALEGIIVLSKNGGFGAVREFAQMVLKLNSQAE